MTVRALRVLGATWLVGVAACGPALPTGPSAALRSGPGETARDLVRREEDILRDLAAVDRRLVVRSHVTPSEDARRRVSMAALLREDSTLAVVDGAIDPFSFDARARELEALRRRVNALPPAADPHRRTERELFSRLVGAELVRVDEERLLPRSASSLVRAIVDTWQPPRTEREAAEDDRWLARRLGELRRSMETETAAAALDVVRARELDDALDALERLASGPAFARATAELVRLRDALESAGSRPSDEGARSEWALVAPGLQAHLGVSAPPERLARELAALEVNLRARAERAASAAGVGRAALSAALEKCVFVSGPCVDAVPGSRVRSMGAPPEREPSCHLRHLVASAEDDAADAVALAAMHDHVVVAEWALDVARGAAPLAKAADAHRLIIPVPLDTRARYERIALARPVAAIGAAETARLLAAGDPRGRATTWSRLGDLPLDMAAAELGAEGAGARTAPGSPR